MSAADRSTLPNLNNVIATIDICFFDEEAAADCSAAYNYGMAATSSTMLDLGTMLPPFTLPDFSGRIVSDADFTDAQGLLVAFICKHCPFVKHIRQEFARFAQEYEAKGVAVVAIASNDVKAFPEDGPEGMKQEAAEAGYSFPYLFDETQQTARAFRAACTPDFFLFDRNRRLVYRGEFDDSRPGNNIPVSGSELRAAADALLAGRPAPATQKPSIGCNIKWRAGRAPDYFTT